MKEIVVLGGYPVVVIYSGSHCFGSAIGDRRTVHCTTLPKANVDSHPVWDVNVAISWRFTLLSRRSAAALGILATLGEVNWGRAAPADSPAGAAAPSSNAPPPRTTVEPVDKDQVVAILGSPVTGPEGKLIGHLTDVLVDGTGQPQAAVLDIGGFMGVGTRSIAVHWKALHFAPSDPKTPITLDLSLDEIKATPEYKGLGDKPAPVVAPLAANPAPAH